MIWMNSRASSGSGRTPLHPHPRFYTWYSPPSISTLALRTISLPHKRLPQLSKVLKPGTHNKLPEPDPQEIHYLSGDEVVAFMGSCWFDDLGTFFELALVTGCRPSELMGLRWENTDLENGSIRVCETLVRDREGWYLRPPKTKQGTRQIPIPARTVETLREHRAEQGEQRLKAGPSWQDHGFVFASVVGDPLERHNLVNRHFRPTLKRAVEAIYPESEAMKDPDVQSKRNAMLKVTTYGLRHTAATLMLEKKVDAKTVSERMGHKTVAFTLDTYVHVTDDMKDTATDALGAALYESV